jgi:nucleotide-binding universal stress UspA family protein
MLKPIVAGTDGSEESLRAVEWAAAEAVLRKTRLRIVSVPALLPRMSADQAGQETVTGIITQAARDALADAAQRATEFEPGLLVDTGLLASGPPARVLLDQAAGAAMLVAGSRGAGGLAAMLLGSASRYLATRAPCPVAVVRAETMAVHREVVVGIDDPDTSAAALEFAFEEAALRKARLLAVHAWLRFPPETGPDGMLAALRPGPLDPSGLPATGVRLDEVLAPWQEKYPAVEAGWEVVHAQPARVLASESARADLLVLGRHKDGPGVGSVTHAVLSHAHSPVVIVPSAEQP